MSRLQDGPTVEHAIAHLASMLTNVGFRTPVFKAGKPTNNCPLCGRHTIVEAREVEYRIVRELPPEAQEAFDIIVKACGGESR